MKKFLLIVSTLLVFGIAASAQRQNVQYATLGVVTDVNDVNNLHPGIDAAYGFRNYNRDAFVSLAYGAEGYAFWLPSAGTQTFGVYGIPQIGVSIGPSAFKVYPHWGFMAGFNNAVGAFNTGSNQGIALEFGKNAGVDFNTYYIFKHAWMTAINFTWRF